MQIRAFLFPKSTKSPQLTHCVIHTSTIPIVGNPWSSSCGAPRTLYNSGIYEPSAQRPRAWTRDRLEKRFPSLHGKLKFLSSPGHRSHPARELPKPSPSRRTAPPSTRTAPRRSHLPDRTGPSRAGEGTVLAESAEPPGPPLARPGRALAPQPAGRCSSVVLQFCSSAVL